MNTIRNAKGEGSFTRNPDGTITHRKGVGWKSDGRRKTLTVTAATKAACIKAMKKKEAAWEKEKELQKISGYMTLAGLCIRHLEYQIENGDLKPKSIDRRECTINNQILAYPLGKLQLQAVGIPDIEKHVKTLIDEDKICATSIQKVVDVINAAYEWAIRRREWDYNPVSAVKTELIRRLQRMDAKNATDADVDTLTDEEIKKFEREALSKTPKGLLKYPAGYQLLLLLHTGMRVGEMLALRWRDWQGNYLMIEKSRSMAKNRNKKDEKENNFIPIEGSTKNQKARMIQLTPEAKYALYCMKEQSIHCKLDDYIAVTRTGKVNTTSNLERRFKILLKNAGVGDINGGLHILRKTFATNMYEKGSRVEEIAAYIGDLESTTRKYYIAVRKKVGDGPDSKHVVKLPEVMEKKTKNISIVRPKKMRNYA